MRRELGPIAVPSEIEFTPTLPKTGSGKIMRRLLKAQELGLNPGDITTLEDQPTVVAIVGREVYW